MGEIQVTSRLRRYYIIGQTRERYGNRHWAGLSSLPEVTPEVDDPDGVRRGLVRYELQSLRALDELRSQRSN